MPVQAAKVQLIQPPNNLRNLLKFLYIYIIHQLYSISACASQQHMKAPCWLHMLKFQGATEHNVTDGMAICKVALEGEADAAMQAIARTAKHRLERGIWTSPGAGLPCSLAAFNLHRLMLEVLPLPCRVRAAAVSPALPCPALLCPALPCHCLLVALSCCAMHRHCVSPYTALMKSNQVPTSLQLHPARWGFG